MLHDIHHIKRAFIFCMTLLTTVACTYDYEIPDSETEPMVVIFGQIVSESECVCSHCIAQQDLMAIWRFIPI